jgi:hypothetical protein
MNAARLIIRILWGAALRSSLINPAGCLGVAAGGMGWTGDMNDGWDRPKSRTNQAPKWTNLAQKWSKTKNVKKQIAGP